jgi:methionine biosynthesis protein MetW
MASVFDQERAAMSAARVDLLLITQMVERGARVLDVGCGDGELLRLLSETRDVDARGIELSQRGVNDCVAKGLFVIQGDADTDLADYPDDAFDYVIVNEDFDRSYAELAHIYHAERSRRFRNLWVGDYKAALLREPV